MSIEVEPGAFQFVVVAAFLAGAASGSTIASSGSGSQAAAGGEAVIAPGNSMRRWRDMERTIAGVGEQGKT